MIHAGERRRRKTTRSALMSLGCVMQSIWLIAEARILEILAIPESVRIGFGYPATPSGGYLRVRPARM
jgi:hypothetical protein